MAVVKFACPLCGQGYEPEVEYLREWAGQATTCTACWGQFELPEAPVPQVWREGAVVVKHKGVRLPERCAKCAVEAKLVPLMLHWQREGDISSRTILSSHRAMRTVSALDWLMNRAEVKVGLCEKHLRRYRRTRKIFRGIIIAGGVAIVGGIAALATDYGFGALGLVGGLVLLVLGPMAAVTVGVPVTLECDSGTHLYLSGFCQEYLEQLPTVEEVHEAEAERAARRLEEMDP